MLRPKRAYGKQLAGIFSPEDRHAPGHSRTVILCKRCITTMLLTEAGNHFCPDCGAVVSVHNC